MSGGPIIDTKGHVIGIISRGMEAVDGGPETGYGACTGSLLEHRVDLHGDDGELHEFAVPELMARSAIDVRDDRVTLTRSADSVALSWA